MNQRDPAADVTASAPDGLDSDPLIREVLTLFMRTETVLRGTRITRNGAVVQPVDDLATGIESAMRAFKHERDAVKASAAISQLLGQLTSRYKKWEVESRQIQQTRVEARNTPSGEQLRKMAAEISAVKTAVVTAEGKIRSLLTALSQFRTAESETTAAVSQALDPSPKTLAPVERMLHDLIGGQLELKGEEASRTEFGSRIRERVFDPKRKVLLVVQWGKWGRDRLALKFWLVPKSPEVLPHLQQVDPEVLTLVDSERGARLPIFFEWVPHDLNSAPESPPIREFFETISRRRFPAGGPNFQYMMATVPTDADFSDGVLRRRYSVQLTRLGNPAAG